MVPEENSLILFKFGATKWMKALKDGKVSFSCPGQYINIAKKTGNSEQGDLYEGVFARLKKTDPRIEQCGRKFGDDLEVLPDGEYVLLRRKSTYSVPTFCFYSFRGLDLLQNVTRPGLQRVRHDFDERMYSGFSSNAALNAHSDDAPATLIIQARPFYEQIMKAIHREGFGAELSHINYKLFENEEFYIEPTDQRKELFYKFPKYRYQKEARILLHGLRIKKFDERYTLNIGPLPDEDAPLVAGIKMYFEITADIEELDSDEV
ncbi:hypothetical protein COLU111180_20645 [Cohnella lubricantis]|uniref:Uncharacterized protein n=1 Tax=Cohnella lubricantis TaxID=2163172 RepID=A0A841TE54_9BACL|nr:hypothetical protein [Cohnella lubricantis]MBB6678335.1 hypothetical protein [Cohnella lubricantis]MBP2120624.1 hypothetical protein [Cohnella lubricantis]